MLCDKHGEGIHEIFLHLKLCPVFRMGSGRCDIFYCSGAAVVCCRNDTTKEMEGVKHYGSDEIRNRRSTVCRIDMDK